MKKTCHKCSAEETLEIIWIFATLFIGVAALLLIYRYLFLPTDDYTVVQRQPIDYKATLQEEIDIENLKNELKASMNLCPDYKVPKKSALQWVIEAAK